MKFEAAVCSHCPMNFPYKYLPNENITHSCHWPIRPLYPLANECHVEVPEREHFFIHPRKHDAPCRLGARFARNKCTPLRKSRGIPRVSTRFSLSMENEQADAGQDGRTRLARPNSQARTGAGKYSFFLVQLTTSRIGSLTWLIYTLLYVMTIHTNLIATQVNQTRGKSPC